MTLTQVLFIVIYPLAVGMALGLFYYGGLWLVLRKLSQLSHPAAWLGFSLLARTLAVVYVVYLLFANSWQQLLVVVLGMLVSRTLLVQRIKPAQRHTTKYTGQAQ